MKITLIESIMIAAVFLGPIIAVQLTRLLDNKKEERERKLDIFKSLMATRSYTTSWKHVEALNQIDLEFDKGNEREKGVVDAWKEYHDHLHRVNVPQNEVGFKHWEEKRVDLFVELLHKMAKVLNYDFDKTHIKNSSYAPVQHGNDEAEQRDLRQGFIRALRGDCALHMAIKRLPKNEKGNQNKQGG